VDLGLRLRHRAALRLVSRPLVNSRRTTIVVHWG
jgi:hypothetical protein